MADAEKAEWDCVDDAVARLERAWRDDDEVDLTRFVPPPNHPGRRPALLALAAIDQEYRWQRGRPKRVEDYLREWPELAGDPDAIVELLDAECRTRAALGEVPTAKEIQGRFSQAADQIDLDEIATEACDRPGPTPAASQTPTIVPAPPGAEPGPRQLEIGQRFGRYEIRDLLGSGGMATVYRAYDVQLGREVALKIPHFHPDDRPAEIERFVRESRLAATLRHRNVCRVYDAGQTDGVHFLTMELIEGDSLETEIRKRGPMQPRRAAETVAKIARALQSMHQAGIIHRDVKAANVMVDLASGEPCLMDFGLAWQSRFDDLLTDARARVGTPAAMSPEQVTGRTVDARSDVYSLGVLLYELLTGRMPIDGPLPDIVDRIAHQPPPSPRQFRPDLDPALEAICLKALNKHPADRYPSAGEMAEALDQYVRQPSPAAPKRRWPPRRLATLAALGLVLGVFAFLKTGSGTLLLDVTPADAVVSIDGRAVSVEAFPAEVPLSVGYHRVTISRPGYGETTRDVAVPYRGARPRLTIRLNASVLAGPAATRPDATGPTVGQPPGEPGSREPLPGTLVLNLALLQRRGAVVTIDGRPQTIRAWPATITLAPGTHLLEVTARRYKTYSERLAVPAGGSVRRDVRLDRDPAQYEPGGLLRRGKLLTGELRGLLGAGREDAADRLGELLSRIAPEDTATATAELMEGLASDDPAVRRLAAEGLAELGPAARSAIPALEKCRNDDHPEVRAAAAHALQSIQQ